VLGHQPGDRLAVNRGASVDLMKIHRVSRHETSMPLSPNCAEIRDGTVGARPSEASEAIEVDVIALYDRYFDFAWRSLKRLGVHPNDLEDATQDVFIVVHQRIDEFEYRATVRSWIFAIAMRVAMAYRRRAQRHRLRIAEDETALVCSRGTPEEMQTALQTAEQVQLVLDGMGDDKRAVFVLAELEQISGQEIAAALGIPRNTVYSRLRLARAEFADGFKRLKAKYGWRNQ
jgi:RNA polymerase sigma-70 factor, ECF subfamily